MAVDDSLETVRACVQSVCEDNSEERVVDRDAARVVLDEPEVPELVHEEVDTGTGRPDHLRENFLRYFWQRAPRSVVLAVLCEEQ